MAAGSAYPSQESNSSQSGRARDARQLLYRFWAGVKPVVLAKRAALQFSAGAVSNCSWIPTRSPSALSPTFLAGRLPLLK